MPSNSFKQFDYSLRPCKQVERKIMIEVLLRLAKAGFAVSDYTYLGFGSVYYVDFVMFHKFLFMDSMICVEYADIPKRMKFNKPFKFIRLKMGALSQHIPSMKSRIKYLVWLDYDRPLDDEMLEDFHGCVTRMAPQSIFVVTVDARPKLPKERFDVDPLGIEEREILTRNTYNHWFGNFVDKPITRDRVARKHAAPLFHEVATEYLQNSLRTTGTLQYMQLFNFLYADGAPMLTFGGMIGTVEDDERLRENDIYNHKFVRTGAEYLHIAVPPLTLREKHWLDSKLDDRLRYDRLNFELDEDAFGSYRDFYKEYPMFTENLY